MKNQADVLENGKTFKDIVIYIQFLNYTFQVLLF